MISGFSYNFHFNLLYENSLEVIASMAESDKALWYYTVEAE